MSTQIQVCVWERCTIIQSRLPTVQTHTELFGIEGEPFEFEWNIFQGLTTNFADSRKDSRETERLPIKSRRIWRPNDLHVRKILKNVSRIPKKVKNYTKRFPRGHWSFPRSRRRRQMVWNPQTWKEWNVTAGVTVENFSESGDPIFGGISALSRGFLKRKGGRCPIHFNAESSCTELLFRTIHSANQLRKYGAAASWCEDLAQLIPGQTHVFKETSVAKANGQLTQKLEAQDGDSVVQTPRRNDEAAGNRLRMYLQNF